MGHSLCISISSQVGACVINCIEYLGWKRLIDKFKLNDFFILAIMIHTGYK